MDTVRINLAELGLTISAKLEDVKKAYRNRAKAVHPDRVHGSDTQVLHAVQKMQILNDIYAKLKQKATATGSFKVTQMFNYAAWRRAQEEKNRAQAADSPSWQSHASSVERSEQRGGGSDYSILRLILACLSGGLGGLLLFSYSPYSTQLFPASRGAAPRLSGQVILHNAASHNSGQTKNLRPSTSGAAGKSTISAAANISDESFDELVRRKSKMFGK